MHRFERMKYILCIQWFALFIQKLYLKKQFLSIWSDQPEWQYGKKMDYL